MRFVGYVLVGACNDGRQVACVMDSRGGAEPTHYRLTKWRRQGRTWTRPAWYPAADVLGAASVGDLRKYRVDGAHWRGAA